MGIISLCLALLDTVHRSKTDACPRNTLCLASSTVCLFAVYRPMLVSWPCLLIKLCRLIRMPRASVTPLHVQRKNLISLNPLMSSNNAVVNSHCQSWNPPQQKQGTRNSILPSVTLKEDCGKLLHFTFYIYIYAFSRRFYPKRLTLHSYLKCNKVLFMSPFSYL